MDQVRSLHVHDMVKDQFHGSHQWIDHAWDIYKWLVCSSMLCVPIYYR